MHVDSYLAGKLQYNITSFALLGLVLLLATIVLSLCLSRKPLIILFIAASLLIPANNRIVIAGNTLPFIRIIIIFFLLRLIFQSKFVIKLNKMDKLLFGWAGSMVLIFVIREGSVGAVINRIAWCINIVGSYVIFRYLIKNDEDIELAIKTMAIVAIVIAAFMTMENFTGKNFFYLIGGSSSPFIDDEGNYRCLGSFGHPISAGIFGATQIPLFAYLYFSNKNKSLAIIGLISVTMITFASSSSTSYISYAVAMGGVLLWRYRERARTLFWISICMLIALHIAMKAPVWALIGRAAVFGGSTAYHRFLLIDQFINRIGEWWLLGTSSTAHWGHMSVQLWDVSNYIVRIGVDGGLLSLVIFLTLLFKILSNLNKSLLANKNKKKYVRLNWSLTVALMTHFIAFIGFSYWDQIFVVLYFIFAASVFVVSVERNSSEMAA